MIKKYCILTFSLCIHLANFSFIEASQMSSVGGSQHLDVVTPFEETRPYIACTEFETTHLKFEAISSADQDINGYMAIYADSGWQNSWFSGSSVSLFCEDSNNPEGIRYIRKELGCDPIFASQTDIIQTKDKEIFRNKEKEGFYQQLLSFPNYLIRHKDKGEIVGKFIFMSIRNGMVESGIYIISHFRKKKFSSEILEGVVSHVIDSALGKSFIFQSKTYSDFKGMYGAISPWYNYPSLKSYHNIGCVTRWEGHAPIAFYPTTDENYLDSYDDRKTFFDLIKESYIFNQYLDQIEPSTSHFKDSREFFDFVNQSGSDDFREKICHILERLCTSQEKNTAIFAKEALDIFDKKVPYEDTAQASQAEQHAPRKRHRHEK